MSDEKFGNFMRDMEMIKQLPPQKKLKELFDYKNGMLFHKKNKGKAKNGNIVGWKEKNGYWATNIDGVRYRIHRLIWQYHFDNCPEMLDHIDRNKDNNSLENLRPATVSLNSFNTIKKNKTELRGVCVVGKKFKACIRINGKSKHLGTFESAKDAHKKYVSIATNIYGVIIEP